MSTRRRVFVRAGILVLLTAAALLSASGVLEHGWESAGLNSLNRSNEQYLERSIARSIATFGVLTGVKIGLAVIEGSELGLGFGLEAGDAVQAAYDYVDIAWRTVLLSSAVLTGTRYLLEALRLVDHWFLAAAALAAAVYLLISWSGGLRRIDHHMFRYGIMVLFIVTTALYVLVPLSVTGGRYLSSRITAPSVESAEASLTAFRLSTFPRQEDGGGILGTITGLKDTLKQTASVIRSKAADMSNWLLKIIAGYLFDCLVFPLLLFLVLLWSVKSTARWLFGIHQQQSLARTMEKIVGAGRLRQAPPKRF